MAERPPLIRVFLVGFPRSGTTLLQSLLAAHPEVRSMPETFFFVDVAPAGRRWRLLGRAHPRARVRLDALREHGIAVAPRSARDLLPGSMIGRFVRSLDAGAWRDGKRAWVEKTPSHLYHANLIERYVPDATILHIVRAGMPAIASLYAVTREHPRPWGGPRPLETCIARWKSDIRLSHDCIGRTNHLFVSYERLVENPAEVLQPLTRRIGLRADPETVEAMTTGYAAALSSVVADEPWKSSVGTPIANRNGVRAECYFSAADRQRIEREIEPEKHLLAAIPFQ
jgi:hypothetical protein